MSDDFYDIVGTQVEESGAEAPRATSYEDRIYIDRSESERNNARRSWAESDGRFWTTPYSHESLPAGLYRMTISDNVGPLFIRQANDTDQLVHIPNSESSKLVQEIVEFKGLKQKFRDNGLLYKRGIMLYGPPGSGKTCTLQFITKLLIAEHGAVAVVVEKPSIAATCLQTLRRTEPHRQLIAIMEDIDALVDRYGQSEYLALLDGENQVDNIVFVATTNYPEKLDARFVDRPSRFDTIRYIGLPSEQARRFYLETKLPNEKSETIDKFVKLSDKFSIAHLREFIILTQCFGMSIDDAATRLKESIKKQLSSTKTPDTPSFGFTGNK